MAELKVTTSETRAVQVQEQRTVESSALVVQGEPVAVHNDPDFYDTQKPGALLVKSYTVQRPEDVDALVQSIRREVMGKTEGRDLVLIRADPEKGEPPQVALVWADELDKPHGGIREGQQASVNIPGPDGQSRVLSGKVVGVVDDNEDSTWHKIANFLEGLFFGIAGAVTIGAGACMLMPCPPLGILFMLLGVGVEVGAYKDFRDITRRPQTDSKPAPALGDLPAPNPSAGVQMQGRKTPAAGGSGT